MSQGSSILIRCARIGALAVALLASGAAFSQDPPEEPFRPQISVVVSEHPTGADMVEITAQAFAYPKDRLHQQAKAIGDLLGAPARGLQAYAYPLDPGNPRLTLIKASFATNGLIDREEGVLRLAPIAKAFAGAPGDAEVKHIHVIFKGERPNDRTVRKFESKAVKVEGEFPKGLGGVEYRITLRTQDPGQMDIPETVSAPPPPAPAQEPPRRTEWLLWTILAVAAAAVGLLVYWTLLRVPARGRS